MYRIDGTVRAIFGCQSNYLEPAAIVSMRGSDFLIVGLETVGKWGAQRQVPQAWWCRLAGDQTATERGTSEGSNRAAAVAEAMA